ncbi:MAG: SpoVA/SpoVAEb family sporulation membrane protein [Firmicutes bacterium]|nr:SpoVA/SpoVAEb family sporulation membrane protein [Bacillota bacterium]
MKKNEQQRKEYEAYVKQFTPKPKLLRNGFKAFLVGGGICCGAYWIQTWLTGRWGLPEQDAKTWVTVILICSAQLITGLGWFDSLAKFCGAGCIVPITGFANAMVSPAIEYKAEGPVLGVGAKLFSVAGPVLVCGITASMIVGMIHWGVTV